MGIVRAIPPHIDLLDMLVNEHGAKDMHEITLLLPTRRSISRLRQLLAKHHPHIMLPRILCLGALDTVTMWRLANECGTTPPCFADAESDEARVMALAEALKDVSCDSLQRNAPYDRRHAIAAKLVELLSECERHMASQHATEALHGGYSRHWQERIRLIRFAFEWQASRQTHSMHSLRNQQLQWLCELLQTSPPQGKWIIAGSTGSQPATAMLMQSIAQLPQGEVWLPGYHETHNAGMAELAQSAGWALQTANTSPANAATSIVAHDEEEEAALVAALMREALEDESKQIACVSADAVLLRRVQAALADYGITANNATGKPLYGHPFMQAALLLLHAFSQPNDSAALLAFLKHPLVTDNAQWVREAELQLRKAQTNSRAVIQSLKDTNNDSAAALIALITRSFDALSKTDNAASHWQYLRDTLLELAGTTLPEPIEPVDALLGKATYRMSGDAFTRLLQGLSASLKYFPQAESHPRLQLLSPMEARLMHYDRLILAGLNEQAWPTQPADSWLYPLLNDDILPSPESMIALQAHDFFSLLHQADDIFITRSESSDGTETLPSRFLMQCETREPHAPYVQWLRQRPPIDTHTPPVAHAPASAMPDTISATGLELLLRDPYAFYARYILKLRPTDPLEPDNDAAIRGSLMHLVMQRFTEAVNDDASQLNETALLQIAERLFKREGNQAAHYFWWPRLQALAPEIVAFEKRRRAASDHIHPEITVETQTAYNTLSARIDRLEHTANGAVIIDYKSGATPTGKEVQKGYSPQLLVAAMACNSPVASMHYVTLKGELKLSPVRENYADYISSFKAHLDEIFARYYEGEAIFHAQPVPAFKPAYEEYQALERVYLWQD